MYNGLDDKDYDTMDWLSPSEEVAEKMRDITKEDLLSLMPVRRGCLSRGVISRYG
ncbi:hypothetical protein LCGC14_0396620 [marine sediment metagenome]|uniref:Uncharacterized protein n=1 Tax=marine sediment metagenome TaxID=412755 RepID=A0A0F9SY71_9ZZZZ